MDWSAVIEKMRWFAKNSNESANALMLEGGKYEASIRHREKADLFFSLAACFEAGLPVYKLDLLVNGITEENRHPES